MTTILIAVGSLVAGVVLGITYSTVTIRRLRRQVMELRTAGIRNRVGWYANYSSTIGYNYPAPLPSVTMAVQFYD